MTDRSILQGDAERSITTAPAVVELSQIEQPPTKRDEPFLVDFDSPNDRDNPLDWPRGKKWAVSDVLSATGFVRIMVSTIMAPALTTIAAELDMNSTESAMALSIYLLATAFGPLVIGPLSELYGRQYVLHASNIWFLAWNIACGFATSKGVLIASRFMAGFGASSIYALAAGVMSDVWRPEERGRSLAMYMLIPLLGSCVGPIIGGFMAARTTWRWMFWSTSAFQGVMIIASFHVFRETYAPTILKRRAECMRTSTGDVRYYSSQERLEQSRSLTRMIGLSLLRPLRMLITHPIIQLAGGLSALRYGLLYVYLSSFADIWVLGYGESVEISGLHYIAGSLGEIVGSQVGGPLMDWWYRRIQHRSNGNPQPESRVILNAPGTVLVAIGFLLYGWAAQHHTHWIVVDIGAFIVTFGQQLEGIPIQAYIIDVYTGMYTGSAMAAVQFLRSMAAFLFPLFAPAMYRALGYGWGNTTLSAGALVVGITGPLVLYFYGARLRARHS